MTDGALRAPELLDLARWLGASKARQDELVHLVVGATHGRFEPDRATRTGTLRDRRTGLVFSLVPGGRFLMGLSSGEEKTLRGFDDPPLWDYDTSSMKPVHEVVLAPFLIARHPLGRDDLERQGVSLVRANRLEWGSVIAFSADEVASVLAAFSAELPSEAQWEWAYRAGTTTLFPWGDRVPEDPEQEHLWVDTFSDEAANERASNRLGLIGMGAAAELCADAWHDDYRGAPVDGSAWKGSGPGREVVRGGAAYVWPWQGCGEWLLLASATRATPTEFGAALRLVVPLL